VSIAGVRAHCSHAAPAAKVYGVNGSGVVSEAMNDCTPPKIAGAEGRRRTDLVLGVLCGTGAAFGWAAGFVGALHGINAGLRPEDITLHRYIWLAPILAYFVFRHGIVRPGGIGWGRGLALTVFAGPLLSLFSYYGFLAVPLGHGAVIQPSSAAVGGLLLTALFLSEPLPRTRVIGALAIVGGLIVFAGESATTIGRSGILGDLSFMMAGLCWAAFGLLLSLWRVDPLRAAAIVSVLSTLIYLPIHAVLFGYEPMIAAGFRENLLQALVQTILAGPGGVFLFTRSVVLLGPGRAAVFPALVPLFTMAIGFVLLGEVPTFAQLAGLCIVLAGFAFVLRR
jgi:drug/metabolite transporter (DMT)-like permease